MSGPSWYRLSADLILLVHTAIVAFVVGGLVLVLIGGRAKWRFVRNPWFRLIHLLAIGVVAAQAWLDLPCPLTTAEMALRVKAGDTVYAGSFIGHWLQAALYYDVPPALFTAVYTVFALLVIGSWIAVRPLPFFASARRAAIAPSEGALRSWPSRPARSRSR